MSDLLPVPATASTVAEADDQPRCPNCSEPLLGEFCYACGQPKKGFIRHLSGIASDFLDTVFNIDSRTLRTLLPLYFRPGFLSLEYFDGRRMRYVTPLRMYFLISVLAFLAMSAVTHFKVGNGNGSGLTFSGAEEEARMRDPVEIEKKRKEALQGLESARTYMPKPAFDRTISEINERYDALLKKAEKRQSVATPAGSPSTASKAASTSAPATTAPVPAAVKPDEVPVNEDNPLNISLIGDTPWDPKRQPVNIGWLNDTSNQWLTDQVGRMVKNAKRAQDDPDRFFAQVFSLAPQTLFVLLPLFALLLKLMYVFKRRLYMEHLIVALHSHSFICLSILLLAGLSALGNYAGDASRWFAPIGWLSTLVAWWIPIYLLIMQKRVYRQSWIMTVLKYGCIGTIYTFLISFGMVANMMLSLASL